MNSKSKLIIILLIILIIITVTSIQIISYNASKNRVKKTACEIMCKEKNGEWLFQNKQYSSQKECFYECQKIMQENRDRAQNRINSN